MDLQLTIDGGEVDHRYVAAQQRPAPGFTAGQREILRHIRLHGFITTTDAGRIMHACRHGRAGCNCLAKWLASDGWDALRRLQARSLVRRYRWLGWGAP